jgi:hypothetical protein
MSPEQLSVGGLLILVAFGVALFIGVIALGFGLRKSPADAERSRLFEMGYYLPRRASRWPQAFFCTAMGLGVPIVAMGFAGAQRSVMSDVWIVACIVSVAAIIGATIVASIVFFRPEPSGQPEKLVTDTAKPALDPDALDFAGRLGRN